MKGKSGSKSRKRAASSKAKEEQPQVYKTNGANMESNGMEEPEIRQKYQREPIQAVWSKNIGKWEAAVEMLTEPSLKAKTKAEIAHELNIPERTMYAWAKMPAFRRALHIRTVEKLQERLPEVLQALYRRAKAGQIRAIELYLKVTGTMIVDNLLPSSKFAGLDDLEFKELFVETAKSIQATIPQLVKQAQNESKKKLKEEAIDVDEV